MIWAGELADHLWALLVISVAACVPGYALSRLLPPNLRLRDNHAAWPLLGAAYWAAALYLLPFRGGIIVAAALALAWAVLCAWRDDALDSPLKKGTGSEPIARNLGKRVGSAVRTVRRSVGGEGPQSGPYALVILLVGSVPYCSPLFTKHVPDGMDASRYTCNARLIAAHAGRPETLAPFAPEIPFGAANHGLPALAAVAVLCGASPAAAILAAIPLTFAALILSIYLLLRLAARRIPAAVTAVAAVWFAKQSQSTLVWGGFPGVLTLAVSLLSTRLLVEALRGKRWSAAIPLGLCVGALPLLHGCIAAGWLHILAPVAAVVGLVISRHRRRGLAHATLAAGLAGAIVIACLLSGRPQIGSDVVEWIRTNELQGRPPGEGVQLMWTAPAYLAQAMGRVLCVLFVVSLGVLALRRRWLIVAMLASAFLLNVLVLINARFDFLPTTLLLYPTRMREFPVGIAALALVLAWQSVSPRLIVPPRLSAIIAVALLGIAFSYHCRYYQRTAFRRVICDEAWQMLRWSAEHLSSRDAFVANLYGTAGAYLPGVAGVAVTNPHVHIVEQMAAARRMAADRPPTHALVIEREAILGPVGRAHYHTRGNQLRELVQARHGRLVFASGPVNLYELTPGP